MRQLDRWSVIWVGTAIVSGMLAITAWNLLLVFFAIFGVLAYLEQRRSVRIRKEMRSIESARLEILADERRDDVRLRKAMKS